MSGGLLLQGHQIWGKLEESDSEGHSASLSNSCDSFKAERRRQVREQLKEVQVNDESSDNPREPSSSSGADGMVDVKAVLDKLRWNDEKIKNQITKETLFKQMLKAQTGTEDAEDEDEEKEGTWSKGSELHEAGQCKPCHYVNTKAGCSNGDQCDFCHLSHQKKNRPRPCKSKRTKCKKMAGLLDQVLAEDPNQLDETVTMLATQGGYLRTVVKSKLRNMQKDGEAPANVKDLLGKLKEIHDGTTSTSTEAKPDDDGQPRALKPGLLSL